jgi:hypothetical protein
LFGVNVDAALGSLHLSNAGKVAQYFGSKNYLIFREKVSRVGECPCVFNLWANGLRWDGSFLPSLEQYGQWKENSYQEYS